MSFKVPEYARDPKYSSEKNGNNGVFNFSYKGKSLFVIASDGAGWEHVSVSKKNQTPSWDEMCFVKRYFWDSDDVVVQFHPKESEYVNNHNHCLHLWRQIGKEIETPPSILIGIK